MLPATWNVDFALVDEREKNRLQEESHELGAMISKLRLGDDEMSIETYIQIKGEEITELELRTNELVDVALNTIFNILREWDPLKIILAIWQPKSHVRLIITRSPGSSLR